MMNDPEHQNDQTSDDSEALVEAQEEAAKEREEDGGYQ